MSPEHFRLDAIFGLGEGKVDRERSVIAGFAVVTQGPVPGHEIEFDEVALKEIVRLGNTKALGVKARFGHPNMSSTALGTFLGRSRNFRLDGDIVRADLHLADASHSSPDGDLGKYVLDLAEEDPEAFGSSMVVEGKFEYRLNKDGTREKGKDGRDLFPLYRPTRLRATDIVDQPAANKALFGELLSGDVQLSAKFTQALDRFLEDEGAVGKAIAFLERYSRSKDREKEPLQKKEPIMPETTPTTAPAQQTAAPAQAQLSQADLDAARAGAAAAERKRVKGILSAAFPGQEALSQELIEQGASLEDAQSKLIADYKQQVGKAQLSLSKDHAAGLGGTVAPAAGGQKTEAPSPQPGALPLQDGRYDETAAKDAWKKLNNQERSEFFDDEGAYLGYVKAAARGHFRPSKQGYEALGTGVRD